ncbi:MAG TPA: hypothetical protein VMY05_04885 [Acidobacteriota bacterium]|nr:hypothetical protein [Acidobacteriota bacterium]
MNRRRVKVVARILTSLLAGKSGHFRPHFMLSLAIPAFVGGILFAGSEAVGAGAEAANFPCVITTENASEVQLVETLSEHTDRVWTVAFSPDGSLLASCGEDGSVIVRPVDTLSSTTVLTASYWVIGLAFSPDGQVLASGEYVGPIRLWDVATSTQIDMLMGHTQGCWSLDFQESSGTLVSGSLDGTVKLWNPSTGALINTLEGHSGAVLSVDFSPTEDLIASSGTDYDIWLWNSLNGDSVRVLEGHTENIGFVKFSPSGTHLASSADDGTVRLWDVATGDQVWSQNAGQSWVNCVNFNPDGTLLLTCGHNGSVVLREAATGNELRRLTDHTEQVLRGAFHPGGAMFATASWDQTVRIWAIPTSIGSTSHTPVEPLPTDSVVVLSQVSECGGITSVTLHYDIGAGFQAVPMFDDGAHGDGSAGDLTFGAKIPPVPLGSSVKYYVSVMDNDGATVVDPVGAPDVCHEYTVPCCVGVTGNVDADLGNTIDIGDLTALIGYLFIPPNDVPACMEAANVNGDEGGVIDVGDLTALIRYLFIPPNPSPVDCG